MYEIIDEYKLYEKETGIIIHISTDKRDTKRLYKKLLAGSGFNGNTPPFFSNNYNNAINEKGG